MMTHLARLFALIALAATVSAQDPQAPYAAASTKSPAAGLVIDLKQHFNNRGTSLDGTVEHSGFGFVNGSTFPAEFLPRGEWVDDGVRFQFTQDWGVNVADNIRANSQTITLDTPREVSAIHLVAAGEDPGGFFKGETEEELLLTFEDGQTDTVGFEVKNWWAIHWTNKGPIRAPYHFQPDGSRNYNATHLFHAEIVLPPPKHGSHDGLHGSSSLNSSRRLVSIQLPGPAPINALHIFAMSVMPTSGGPHPGERGGDSNKLAIRSVTATRRWEIVDDHRGQIVEVTLANPYSVVHHGDRSAWLEGPVKVSLQGGKGTQTLRPAILPRLMPGDEVTLEIPIKPESADATFGGAYLVFDGPTLHMTWGGDAIVGGSEMVHDWGRWTDEADDLEQHSAPAWYRGAKFGIFIHWGLFSVPAFGGEHDYAEWYNYWLHDDPVGSTAYKHHLETYGPDFVYDDLIPLFTASKFNASAWVELFAEAGAKYFVLTTKHHDGFALFDTKHTSGRSSVRLGPKRDFLKELMEAAEVERPELRRGTYFSMPEWYNPSYQKYGKVLFPGGLAHNPFHPDTTEPYTGYVEVGDYLEDIQLAQMRILAQDYKTEIMWCDIGLANRSATFAAEWFAQTSKEGRQVTIDNRCGIAGDFDTPEMTKFENVQKRTWETCASVDPHSFGYNAATKPEDYRSAKDIIHSLIDITAKGGNFLLNVGPNGDGEIIDAQARPLLEAGRWLKVNGKAIYDTVPFALLPEVTTDRIHVQFTQTHHAFYIISLQRPTTPHFEIDAPLPILDLDKIRLLGAKTKNSGKHDGELEWRWRDGLLSIEIEEEALDAVEGEPEGIAWVFEVEYRGEGTARWERKDRG